MSLSSAMLVGFTGIKSNQTTVDTVGDNLANANTTSFKSQRTLFETLLYRNVHPGTGPSAESGGTLPRQIGSGSTVAAIQRDFKQGGFESTGFASDLAVDGKGFFVLEDGAGESVYTRDGAFNLDQNDTLVSAAGAQVQAFTANADGTINEGQLDALVIPLGSEIEPVATTLVTLDGRLDPAGNIAGSAAEETSDVMQTASGVAATDTTALTALVDTSGVPLFATGDTIAVNAKKGGAFLPEARFVVGTDGSSLGDFAQHLEAVLGIQADAATGGDPGVTMTDGRLVVRSNTGEANAIELDSSSITNVDSPVGPPFQFTRTQEATGSSISTSYNMRDSLGAPVELRLRMVLESRGEASTTWRYYAESVDDTDLSPALGSGSVTFDSSGRFLSATNTSLTVDRQGTGAATPLDFELDFSGVVGLASPDGGSAFLVDSDDGKPAGVLVDYRIENDGLVIGTYTNEVERTFGQIALATFANEEGLLAVSENVYKEGFNSGEASIVAPQSSNAGSVQGGRLEQSNVEIAREFINLITASTGISAASRVVRTSDELLQELLLLAR